MEKITEGDLPKVIGEYQLKETKESISYVGEVERDNQKYRVYMELYKKEYKDRTIYFHDGVIRGKGGFLKDFYPTRNRYESPEKAFEELKEVMKTTNPEEILELEL